MAGGTAGAALRRPQLFNKPSKRKWTQDKCVTLSDCLFCVMVGIWCARAEEVRTYPVLLRHILQHFVISPVFNGSLHLGA